MRKIFFTNTAHKDFRSLERRIQERVLGALSRIRNNPYKYLKKLVGYPYYRLRVGDYRVIIQLEEDSIIVLRIGHRKNIYKLP